MHFIVYKTTNLVNGKYYIGQHKTKNLDDGYIGSGKLLKRAIEKYGYSNFKREILFECVSAEQMNQIEKQIITNNLIENKNCYNIKLGGEGGFDHINSNSTIQRSKAIKSNMKQTELRKDPSYAKNISESISLGLKKSDIFKQKMKDRRAYSDEFLLEMLEKNVNSKSPVKETLRQLNRALTGGLARRCYELQKSKNRDAAGVATSPSN